MNRYEILILAIPELTKDEESSIEKNLEKVLNDSKGVILSFERWGKYNLAYPVKGHDYGVYFLVRFEVEGKSDFLKEIQSLFQIKFNEYVMRHVITKIKDGQSLEYKKPQALEDVPKKHVGLFDKRDSRSDYSNIDKDLKHDDLDEDNIDLEEDSDDVSDRETMLSPSKVNDEKSVTVDLDQDEVA